MTTRYQKRHYEDVAKLLSFHWDKVANDSPVPVRSPARSIYEATIQDFADLFAADNPPVCDGCNWVDEDHQGDGKACFNCGRIPPAFQGGFDRARFLAACGLESEG